MSVNKLFTALLANALMVVLCNGCNSYVYKDWTGTTFRPKSSSECAIRIPIVGCTKWTCDYEDIWEAAERSAEEREGWDFDISKCKLHTDDCSVEPEALKTDKEYYQKIFKPLCNIHDYCYSNKDRSKYECDLDFRDNLLEKCKYEHPWPNSIEYMACLSAVGVYHAAVSLKGETHHKWSEYECKTTAILTSNEGSFGSWSDFKFCNNGYYAKAFYLKVESKQGSNEDDTSANGFKLVCDDSNIISVSNNAPWGDWERRDCNNGENIKGFRSKVEDFLGANDDDTALNSIEAYCTDGQEIVVNSEGNWGSWGGIAECPDGSFVCGFRQRVEANCGNDCDDTTLNAVQLACCPN